MVVVQLATGTHRFSAAAAAPPSPLRLSRQKRFGLSVAGIGAIAGGVLGTILAFYVIRKCYKRCTAPSRTRSVQFRWCLLRAYTGF